MAGFSEATWLVHRPKAYEALATMLSQYGWERWKDIPRTAAALLDEPALLDVLMVPAADDQAAAMGLRSHEAEWLRAMRALAALSEKHLKPWQADCELDLWHDFMSAGENALAELARYGLVEEEHGGGTWTQRGRALLSDNRKG